MRSCLEGWYQWEGGVYKERISEHECDRNIMYSYMKMEKYDLLKLFKEWGGRIKENVGGVNLRYSVSTFANVTMYP
jgi:hypothetical protein